MDRTQFIKSSLLTFAAISTAPGLVKAFDLGEISNSIELKENLHIRHGYYGSEYTLNEFKDSLVKSMRIDRFMNPEGDMSLYELHIENQKIRIAHTNNGLMIQSAEETVEIANNSERIPAWKLDGITISTNPSSSSNDLYHLELGTAKLHKGLNSLTKRDGRFYLTF